MAAATLGVRDQPDRSLHEAVLDFLSSREALLVLDNCEQVVDAVADLATLLLQQNPDLRILATSREPLGTTGEATLRVPPLTVPDPDREPTLRGLPRYDAVSLFTERATAAVSTFTLTDANKTAVTRICHRLDGLPLPIELAAARLRAMSPEQILTRLSDRYALLTRGSRGHRHDSRPSGCVSTGATTSAPHSNNACGHDCRCSPAASSSMPQNSCAARK